MEHDIQDALLNSKIKLDLSKLEYENPPYKYAIYGDTTKYVKWNSVPPECKQFMFNHIGKCINYQMSDTHPSIYIPGFLQYLERKYIGPNTAVLYSHAILEYLNNNNISKKPFTLTSNGQGWSINFIYNN